MKCVCSPGFNPLMPLTFPLQPPLFLDFKNKKTKQKLCIERFSNFSYPHGKNLAFSHQRIFMGIDRSISALSHENRLAIREMMKFSGYFHRSCHFFGAIRLNLYTIIALYERLLLLFLILKDSISVNLRAPMCYLSFHIWIWRDESRHPWWSLGIRLVNLMPSDQTYE